MTIDRYTPDVFLKELKIHTETDSTLHITKDKGGWCFKYNDIEGAKIRVTCNLNKDNNIVISIYFNPDYKNTQLAENWKKTSAQLAIDTYNCTSSAIWLKEKRLISSLDKDISWTVEQMGKMKTIIDSLAGTTRLPTENIDSSFSGTSPNMHEHAGKREKTHNSYEQIAEIKKNIQYPIIVKIDLSSFEDTILKEKQGLCRLKAFGDIPCRYGTNEGEAMCFVLQFCPEHSEQQIIFGIRRELIRGKEGKVCFQLDGKDKSWKIIPYQEDAIPALPLTYGMTSSWAVGPKTLDGKPAKTINKKYSRILHDWIQGEKFTDIVVRNNSKEQLALSECIPATLDSFTPSMVLLGQNWSKGIWDVCDNDMNHLREAYWQNFQPGNAAYGKGGLLRDALEGTLFEKAYMTDIEKGNISTDSGQATRNAREFKANNNDILYNEFQDLRTFGGVQNAHLVIGVWGKNIWDNKITTEMKAGEGKWNHCEFRLIGSHYGTNPVDRKRCINDFTSSMTWAKVLFERITMESEAEKTLLRHICYVAGINIQNELYRKSKEEGGFGAVGTNDRKGDNAVEFLYSETIKQAGVFPKGMIGLISDIKNKVSSIFNDFNAPYHERGKKTYEILIKNLSQYPSVLDFLEDLSNSIKIMLPC